jgi:hypothetical protein
MNTKQVEESMEYLKSKHWTDLGTRAVIIDVVCYNPNIRMFISARLYVCEICARTFVYKMIMDVVCYDLNIRMFISVRQCMCVCMYMRVCLGTRAMSRDH